jgi:hypothetical protein
MQSADGSLEVLTPEQADKRLAAMDAKTRALYENG